MYLTVGGPGVQLWWKLGVALVTAAFVDLLLLELVSYPRRLELDVDGVTFAYRLHKGRRNWAQLDPELFPLWACTVMLAEPYLSPIGSSRAVRSEKAGIG